MYVLLLCIQLSIAIEAANKDSVTSSTVLSLARSSATLPSPRQSVQADQTGRPSGDPVMTEVQECCPCWMKFCTCNCISKWKESRGYRTWRSMRHKIKKLVEHRYFEWAILLIIVASSITLVRAYAFPYMTLFSIYTATLVAFLIVNTEFSQLTRRFFGKLSIFLMPQILSRPQYKVCLNLLFKVLDTK